MKDETYIAVLLDRSGSMKAVRDDTIGGFNQFLADQQSAGANALLTLVQFDTVGIDTVHESVAIREVPKLTEETFVPRGGTPLLDALGKTLASTGSILEKIPESNRPDKVLFVIITDGEENSSREYTKTRIKEMIEHQTDVYNWQFIYLGANQDAFAEAGSMGISAMAAVTLDSSNTRESYQAMSANVRAYRSGGGSRALNWSGPQRAALGKKKEKKTA